MYSLVLTRLRLENHLRCPVICLEEPESMIHTSSMPRSCKVKPKTAPNSPFLPSISLLSSLVAPNPLGRLFPFLLMRELKEGAAMAAPLPHGCHLSSLHFPHHRNMKTECSRLKEDDPLLCSLIHALKHGMEVVSLLLPLLSMVWRPWRAPPMIPNAKARLQPYGIVCAAASLP
ncbi:hypothetical protein U9M48_039769 [Paspalum notatum var. saurae]|uniref:Uncharacterized protein n=1 Tax=Paspalum notatum var. saurae TaxID=547442 RepID=A0AAQ3ULC1_PASNO